MVSIGQKMVKKEFYFINFFKKKIKYLFFNNQIRIERVKIKLNSVIENYFCTIYFGINVHYKYFYFFLKKFKFI